MPGLCLGSLLNLMPATEASHPHVISQTSPNRRKKAALADRLSHIVVIQFMPERTGHPTAPRIQLPHRAPVSRAQHRQTIVRADKRPLVTVNMKHQTLRRFRKAERRRVFVQDAT